MQPGASAGIRNQANKVFIIKKSNSDCIFPFQTLSYGSRFFSQHHGWETVMTGKTILLLSAAAAGVLALFIAVRIYEPVHEIPVSLKIKNDTDGTIRDCLLICNQRERMPLGEIGNGKSVRIAYVPDGKSELEFEYFLHHKRYFVKWQYPRPMPGCCTLDVCNSRTHIRYSENNLRKQKEDGRKSVIWMTLNM